MTLNIYKDGNTLQALTDSILCCRVLAIFMMLLPVPIVYDVARCNGIIFAVQLKEMRQQQSEAASSNGRNSATKETMRKRA